MKLDSELIKMFKDTSDKDVLEIIAEAERRFQEIKQSKKSGKSRELSDFKTFINTYFSHYITAEFGSCQNQLIRDIIS